MGIAALSVLPAILALLGRFAFIPFIPRPEEMIQEMEEKKEKKYVVRNQRIRFGNKDRKIGDKKTMDSYSCHFNYLGGLAAFVPKMQYTYALLDSFPEDMPSREGFTLISDHYPPGEIAPARGDC